MIIVSCTSPWQSTLRQNQKTATDFLVGSVMTWTEAGAFSSKKEQQLFDAKQQPCFSGLMGGSLSRVTALLGSGRSNRQVLD